MMTSRLEAQHAEDPPALVERFARAVEREQGGGSGRGSAHGRDLDGDGETGGGNRAMSETDSIRDRFVSNRL